MTKREIFADGKLTVETRDSIQILTINRPECRNALDNQTAEALANGLARFEENDEISVAIISGAGGAFCAGGRSPRPRIGRDVLSLGQR